VYRIARAVSFLQLLNDGGGGSGRGRRRFNWRDALADAAIIAGLNFFSALAGISATQIITEPIKALLAACVSAGLGFFSTLAFKRGLKTNA